ncbi:SRPBCC family protein [Geodermatophilus sp. SYSU D00684]
MEQSARIDVEAPVGRVWEVLREVERWRERTPTVTAVRRLDDGPPAVGSRVRVEQPRIPPTEYVVTELEPGRSSTWVATSPGVRTTARHRLEELGTGGTRLTLAVEQAGPVGAVMGRFSRRLTDRHLTAEADGIKATSEGRV